MNTPGIAVSNALAHESEFSRAFPAHFALRGELHAR